MGYYIGFQWLLKTITPRHFLWRPSRVWQRFRWRWQHEPLTTVSHLATMGILGSQQETTEPSIVTFCPPDPIPLKTPLPFETRTFSEISYWLLPDWLCREATNKTRGHLILLSCSNCLDTQAVQPRRLTHCCWCNPDGWSTWHTVFLMDLIAPNTPMLVFIA